MCLFVSLLYRFKKWAGPVLSDELELRAVLLDLPPDPAELAAAAPLHGQHADQRVPHPHAHERGGVSHRSALHDSGLTLFRMFKLQTRFQTRAVINS